MVDRWNNFTSLYSDLNLYLESIFINPGTIFGIFKEKEECLLDFGEVIKDKDTYTRLLQNLQPSRNLIAAGDEG